MTHEFDYFSLRKSVTALQPRAIPPFSLADSFTLGQRAMVQMGQVIGVFCYSFWDNGSQTVNTLPISGDNFTTLWP